MATRSAGTQDSAVLEVDLTVDTNAYASGDLIGAKLSLTVPPWAAGDTAGFLIQSVSLKDLAKQNAAIDVVFFHADPSGTTFTDNAALDVADADVSKIAGFAQVLTYASFNDNSYAQAGNLAIPVVMPAGATLYACLVSRGTPTYAASDLSLRVGIVRA